MPATRPPLDLNVEVTQADGSTVLWDSNAKKACDRPQGLTFSTKRGEGFSSGGCTLARRIDGDYYDLQLYDDLRFIGAGAEIAYEGRQATFPRSQDGSGHTVQVSSVGWIAHASDNTFRMPFVDRNMGNWGAPNQSRRASYALAGLSIDVDYTFSADASGVTFSGTTGKAIPASSASEAWYSAPPGCTIAKVAYRGTQANTTSVEAGTLYAASDEILTGLVSNALTLNGAINTATLSTARQYLMLRAIATGTHTPAAANPFGRAFSLLGVYGNHGLTSQPVSGDADGILGSDALKWIATNYAPKLDTSGVQTSTTPIGQLSFVDRTKPYDAFLTINAFSLWELGVWENRQLVYEPSDLTDYDWEVRYGEPGTSVSLQGDSTDDLRNGIVVQYTNVLTGQPDELTPLTTPALGITDPTHPANAHGLTAWGDPIQLSFPATPSDAAAIGALILAESQQPKGAGTISVQGHIKDRQGNWQPVWKVRASDRICITNFGNDRNRLIVETDYSHDTRTLSIAVDSPFKRTDAVLDRITNALQAAGLA